MSAPSYRSGLHSLGLSTSVAAPPTGPPGPWAKLALGRHPPYRVPEECPEAIGLANLERASHHAVDIAEQVWFLVTGEFIEFGGTARTPTPASAPATSA
jgi:hypothetical protein